MRFIARDTFLHNASPRAAAASFFAVFSPKRVIDRPRPNRHRRPNTPTAGGGGKSSFLPRVRRALPMAFFLLARTRKQLQRDLLTY